MLKDITLGQYFPGNSFIHRLDARTKFIMSIIFIVDVFLAKNVFAFLFVTLFILSIIIISKINIKVILKAVKPVIFVMIFTVIINIFWMKGENEPLFSFWRINIYLEGIYRALLVALRFVLLVISTSVLLTYTTSPFELTSAIESLLTPLKYIKVPVHDFAMMMTLALRFIPTLIEETDKIMNAQKARGADFTSGSIFKRAKAMIPILIPLIVSAFSRADDLAIAMECRCYNSGKGATKLNKSKFRVIDLVSLLLIVMFTFGIIFINKYITYGFSL